MFASEKNGYCFGLVYFYAPAVKPAGGQFKLFLKLDDGSFWVFVSSEEHSVVCEQREFGSGGGRDVVCVNKIECWGQAGALRDASKNFSDG